MLNEFELWDEIKYSVYDKTCIITSISNVNGKTVINAISLDLSFAVSIDEPHIMFWYKTGRNFREAGEAFYNAINKEDWGD